MGGGGGVGGGRGPLQLYLFFVCVFLNRRRKVFVAEETTGLHRRELLKCHEYFPILFFEGSLSVEISL